MNDSKKPLDLEITSVINNSEKNLQTSIQNVPETEIIETIEKCFIEKSFETIILNHLLNVDVLKKDKGIKKTKLCTGHKSKKKSRDPKKDKHKRERELESDPLIKNYSVRIEESGLGHRDLVISSWVHINDATCCDSFKEHSAAPENIYEEIEVWEMDQPELLESLDCTMTKTEYGKPETRLINGQEIHRPFWIKTQHLKCIKEKQNGCNFINEKLCILNAEKCIKKIGNQCLIFEKTFKCKTRKPQEIVVLSNINGTDSKLWDIDYQPNQSFPEITIKLSVFDEIKKDLQNSNVSDARSAKIFNGIQQKCSKNVANDIMYDCCFGMDGFATQIKLSKCSSEEIALSAAREKGLTHYIGKKKEMFLGLWESRTEHVFCVFPTKLARVFQEEARKQLGIVWGDAEHPNCRGLTPV